MPDYTPTVPQINIHQGENLLIYRQLLLSDGVTPIVVSTLTSYQVQLIQKGSVIQTLVGGSGNPLRPDPNSTTGIILELTTAITSGLIGSRDGIPLVERYTLERSDTAYVAEPNEAFDTIDQQEITIFS